MLIITRKTGASIVINNDIEVTVLAINHGQVRIGIQAPKDIPVYRKELKEKIESEKQRINELDKCP